MKCSFDLLCKPFLCSVAPVQVAIKVCRFVDLVSLLVPVQICFVGIEKVVFVCVCLCAVMICQYCLPYRLAWQYPSSPVIHYCSQTKKGLSCTTSLPMGLCL